MLPERDLIISLGNKLLKAYCQNVVRDITNVSKWTFRDQLILNISVRWGLDYTTLPSEETFYRAFRKGNCSSAMKEKIAVLFYAAAEEQTGSRMNGVYLDISQRQRLQTLAYWHRFADECCAESKNEKSTRLMPPDKNIEQWAESLSETEIENLFNTLHKVRSRMKMVGLTEKQLKQLKEQREYQKADALLKELQYKDESELAAIYYQRAVFKELQLKFEEALAFYKKAVELNSSETEYTGKLGALQIQMDKLDDAIITLDKVLFLETEKNGKNSRDVGISYRHIGIIWFRKGEYKKAADYYLKAKSIYQINEMSLAPIYNDLGCVYDVWGQYQKAYKAFYKAYQLNLAEFGEPNEDVANNCHNIGHALNNLKKYNKALPWYEKALQLDNELFGENHYNVASDYNSIGSYWFNIGNYPNALVCFQTSRDIVLKIFGSTHNETALRYYNVGKVLCKQGKFGKAIPEITTAIEIISKILPPTHAKFGNYYNTLSEAHAGLKDYKKAVEYAGKALPILLQHFDKKHPRVVNAKNNLKRYKAHLLNSTKHY